MIKFPGSDREYVQVKDCSQIESNGCKLLICPKCKNHKRGDPMKFSDCKTVIYENELTDDGRLKIKGQCMCYSKEHGERKDWGCGS